MSKENIFVDGSSYALKSSCPVEIEIPVVFNYMGGTIFSDL